MKNTLPMKNPVHPGQIVRHDCLEEVPTVNRKTIDGGRACRAARPTFHPGLGEGRSVSGSFGRV